MCALYIHTYITQMVTLWIIAILFAENLVAHLLFGLNVTQGCRLFIRFGHREEERTAPPSLS